MKYSDISDSEETESDSSFVGIQSPISTPQGGLREGVNLTGLHFTEDHVGNQILTST